MTLADLKSNNVETIRAIPTGKQYRASNGKMKDETVLVAYVRTAAGGEMTTAKWYSLMDAVVEQEGLGTLLKKIENVCKESCVWLKTEKEIHQYALECLSSGNYKAWREFGGNPREDGATTPEAFL